MFRPDGAIFNYVKFKYEDFQILSKNEGITSLITILIISAPV
jgi:hypothetical protein